MRTPTHVNVPAWGTDPISNSYFEVEAFGEVFEFGRGLIGKKTHVFPPYRQGQVLGGLGHVLVEAGTSGTVRLRVELRWSVANVGVETDFEGRMTHVWTAEYSCDQNGDFVRFQPERLSGSRGNRISFGGNGGVEIQNTAGVANTQASPRYIRFAFDVVGPATASGLSVGVSAVGGASTVPSNRATPQFPFEYTLNVLPIHGEVRQPPRSTPAPSRPNIAPELLTHAVFFELEGQDEISDRQRSELDAWVDLIGSSNADLWNAIAEGDVTIRCEGRATTTETTTNPYTRNVEHSQSRANAVARAMVGRFARSIARTDRGPDVRPSGIGSRQARVPGPARVERRVTITISRDQAIQAIEQSRGASRQ